jgi:biotin carboxyl carrier protein
MDFEFLWKGSRQVISLEQKAGRYIVSYGGMVLETDVRELPDGTKSFLVGGRSFVVSVARADTRILVSVGGTALSLRSPGKEAPGRERGEEAGETSSTLVRAPMPGRVIKISVAESETVRRNQTLAVVEAMKMENEIKSPREATVRRIFVAAGDLVDADKPLLELEPKAQG